MCLRAFSAVTPFSVITDISKNPYIIKNVQKINTLPPSNVLLVSDMHLSTVFVLSLRISSSQNPARVDFLVKRCRLDAGQKFSLGQNPDHRRVVGAKIFLRKPQREAFAPHARASSRRNADCKSRLRRRSHNGRGFVSPLAWFSLQHFDDRRLHAGAQIAQPPRLVQQSGLVHGKNSAPTFSIPRS